MVGRVGGKILIQTHWREGCSKPRPRSAVTEITITSSHFKLFAIIKQILNFYHLHCSSNPFVADKDIQMVPRIMGQKKNGTFCPFFGKCPKQKRTFVPRRGALQLALHLSLASPVKCDFQSVSLKDWTSNQNDFFSMWVSLDEIFQYYL